eukprot:17776-Heterococcus_DN1.PRE.3
MVKWHRASLPFCNCHPLTAIDCATSTPTSYWTRERAVCSNSDWTAGVMLHHRHLYSGYNLKLSPLR